MFELSLQQIGRWNLTVLRPANPARLLSMPVQGLIGNAVANTEAARSRKRAWQLAVGNAVRDARGADAFDPMNEHIITLGFSFHPPSHGNGALDVENFVKPTLDAVAGGLFCPTPLEDQIQWNHDDSRFTAFLVLRLPDAITPEEEGLALQVCEVVARRAPAEARR